MEPLFDPSRAEGENATPGHPYIVARPISFPYLPAQHFYRTRDRYWLHGLLLLLAFLTTTIAGANLARSFALGSPFADFDDWFGYTTVWHNPALLITGLPFSLALLAILLAHEMGHYVTAQYHRVDASLPYFLPVPWLFGTMGAFIRIRSHIRTRRALFDIGVAGPIAGFVVLVVMLALGVSLSRVVPGVGVRGELIFGRPLLFRMLAHMFFPNAYSSDILMHPIARAAWVGMLTTALNLLPVGQLDGGHILYAFLGNRAKMVSRAVVAVMVAFGLYQLRSTHLHAGGNWLVWALVLFFLALRHPEVYDTEPLDSTRAWVGISSAAIFLLCFMLNPVRT